MTFLGILNAHQPSRITLIKDHFRINVKRTFGSLQKRENCYKGTRQNDLSEPTFKTSEANVIPDVISDGPLNNTNIVIAILDYKTQGAIFFKNLTNQFSH